MATIIESEGLTNIEKAAIVVDGFDSELIEKDVKYKATGRYAIIEQLNNAGETYISVMMEIHGANDTEFIRFSGEVIVGQFREMVKSLNDMSLSDFNYIKVVEKQSEANKSQSYNVLRVG